MSRNSIHVKRETLLRCLPLLTVALLVALPATADTRIEKRLDLISGGTFRLETDSGSVSVVGTSADGAEIVVTSRKDDIEDDYEFKFDSSGNTATVEVKRRGSKLFNWGKGEGMHFEVRVPSEIEVFVDTSGGRIELESIDGEVDLRTSGGRIEAKKIGGRVNADTSGGSINISNVEGDVRADTSGGSISISEVSGEVVADTSGGRISMRDIGGDIVADTSGGGIDIEGASGSVKAETSGGPVLVAFTAGNAAGGSLSSSGGRVTAIVDPSVNLDIDASSSGGSVKSDVPVTVVGTISKSHLKGELNGGGALLRLRSSGGGVRIESE